MNRANLAFLLPLLGLADSLVDDSNSDNISIGLGELAVGSQLAHDNKGMVGYCAS